jgi:hypothetical protein
MLANGIASTQQDADDDAQDDGWVIKVLPELLFADATARVAGYTQVQS